MSDRQEVQLADGRTVIVHSAGAVDPAAPVLVLHYGTPHTGKHPARIAETATDLGLRLWAATRPGFGGSPRRPGRTVADTALDVSEALDRLGIDQVATAGYSGGGPHALALAALLGGRVSDVAVLASPAPYDHTAAWFEGMASGGGGLRPAAAGLADREEHQRTTEFQSDCFTEADWAALAGPWGGIGEDAQAASAAGSDEGEIDDDLAFVLPWGVNLEQITAHVTVFQGIDDRIIPAHHANQLASIMPAAELRRVEGSGHVAVLDQLPHWMRAIAGAHPVTSRGPAQEWHRPYPST